MPAPVFVQFQVGGVRDVQRAFQTIEQSAIRHDRSIARAASRGVADRIRTEERAASQRTTTEERTARERVRIMRTVDREVLQAKKRALRDLEREEERSSRKAMQWVKHREREELASQRRVARQRERFARAIGEPMRYGLSRGVNTVARGALSLTRSALSIGGGFSIADALNTSAKTSAKATEIANAGWISGKARPDSRAILSEASAVGTREGISTEDVLEGLSVWTGQTGALDTGRQILADLGELASATGSNFSELAQSAAEVFNIDSTQNAEDLMLTMRALAGQGKLASVEMKDLAKYAAKVTSSAGKFAGSKAANIRILGAMAQEAKLTGGAASSAEATTAVARFADDVAKNRGRFKKAGIETMTEEGVIRGPKDIVMDTLRATGGDVAKITSLFGVRSAKTVQGFADIYRSAGGMSKDPAKQAEAMQAVEAEFKRLGEALLSQEQLNESAAATRAETSRKLESAMNKLRDSLGEKLLPEIIKAIPAFEGLIPQIVSTSEEALPIFLDFVKKVAEIGKDLSESNIIKMMSRHPIGAIIGGWVVKELAAAGIARILSTAMVSATIPIKAAGATVGASIAAAGAKVRAGLAATGLAGVAVAGAAAAYTAYGAYKTATGTSEVVKATGEEVGADTKESFSLVKALRGGTATPEDREKAQAKLAELKGKLSEAQGTDTGALSSFWAGVKSTAGFDEDSKKITRAEMLKQNQFATETAITQLTKALQENADALKKTGGMSDPGHPSRNSDMALRGGSNQ